MTINVHSLDMTKTTFSTIIIDRPADTIVVIIFDGIVHELFRKVRGQ